MPKPGDYVTELQLARGATRWLRKFGIATAALVVTVSFVVGNFLGAQSSADGSDSEIDYAMEAFGAGNTGFYSYNTQILPARDDFTVEVWVKPDALPNQWHHLVHNRSADNYGRFDINIGAGTRGSSQVQIIYAPRTSDTADMVNLTPNGFVAPIGEWTHLAVAVDVNVAGRTYTIDLFRNGQLFSSTTVNNADFQSLQDDLFVGFFSGSTRTLDGQLDQVKVWNQALTEAQVAASMHVRTNENVPGSPSLRHAYDFNEGSGSTVYDRVGGDNLTQIGSPARVDVKLVSAAPGGDTVIAFPRTYLPGVGGWTVPQNSANVQALVVAGGGGGGGDEGGGGGAGGLTESSLVPVASSTLSVVVGMGGFGANNEVEPANNGQDSVFGQISTLGGGAGGDALNSNSTVRDGADGGSGGGGAGEGSSYTIADAGSGTPGQGNDGSVGFNTWGGGGGGAGAAAVQNAGGSGRAVSILTSTVAQELGLGEISSGSVYFAGGGGAGAGNGGSRGLGGLGGGGDGNTSALGTQAIPNTGGGGGGGGTVATGTTYGVAYSGNSGASGVVIVRYSQAVDQAWSKEPTEQSYAYNSSAVIDSASLTWTVEGWFNFTAADVSANWTGLMAQQNDVDTNTNRFQVWLSAGKLVVTTGGSSNETWPTMPALEANRWYHLAIGRTGNNLVIHVDGQQLHNASATWGTIGSYFTVGGARYTSGTVKELGGQIDQVKVWGGSLDETDVKESMHAYSSSGVSTTAPLRAHYDFNEWDMDRVLDRSGQGRHLSFNKNVVGGYLEANFTSASIVESGSAYGEQTFAKFNRSYLTANGGWTPPSGVTRYKALVLAGGGGGGAWVGGGGGAGGLLESSEATLSEAAIPVTVGQGGLGAYFTGAAYLVNGVYRTATSGQDSSVGTQLEAAGGGRGASHWNGDNNYITQALANPTSGGSGGGGSGYWVSANGYNAPDNAAGAAGTSGQGNAGGSGVSGVWQAAGGGGAGGPGEDGTTSGAGDGGAGKTSFIVSSAGLQLAGGGAGADHDGALEGVGTFGGGSAGRYGTSGLANTGGGGGGGAWPSGTGNDSSGGAGADGVVILSWGPYLEVTSSPAAARVGEEFTNPIKIQLTSLSGEVFVSTSPVTLTASAGVLTLNGEVLTQSLTVNAVGGIVTFDGLGLASSVTGAQTLTFTSDAFVGTSLTVTPSFFPLNVNIANGVTTQGRFVEGSFYASSSAGVTNILVSDLANHLVSYSTVVSASGYISVAHSFNSGSSSEIVLKAASYVELKANAQIRTDGGDIVLWADSDNTSGGFIRMYNSSELCTTAGTCDSTTTGGGNIVLGGGAPSPENPERPGGPAVGATGGGQSQNSSNTVTGISIGVIGDGGASLFSAGGDIFAHGKMAPSVTSFGHGLMVRAGSTINSGLGKIKLIGESNTGATTSTANGTGLLKFNQDNGAVLIRSISTASDAVIVEGRSPQNTAYGIYSLNTGTTIDSAGGFILRSDHISSGLGLAISVSGQVVVEPYSGSLRDTPTGTSFVAEFVNSSDSSGQKLRLMREPAGVRIGSASNSNLVTLNTSFTSARDIEVIGGTISVASNPEIISTGQSSKIILKARDWISADNGSNASTRALLQTNDGDIVLWSDSDGNHTGWVYVGQYVTLDSGNGRSGNALQGGGRITIAGGDSGVDVDGHPLGATSDSGTNTYALVFQSNSKLSSAGGDVTIRAASDSNYETFHNNSNSTINSGTGQIRVEVSHRNLLTAYRTQGASWVSAATVSPAIELLTQTTATGNPALVQSEGQKFELISTGDVDVGISISALVGTAITSGITLPDVTTLISAQGDIQIQTNGYLTWSNPDSRSIGAKAGSDVTSSSGDITITAAAFIDATSNAVSKISTSGYVKILPYATNFNANSELQFGVEAGSFEFGNVAAVNSSTKNIKISRDVQVAGAITVSAAAITVDLAVDLVTSNPGAGILLKSRGWIDVDNVNISDVRADDSRHSLIQTNNGDIVFWADSDANEQGLIWISHNTTLNSANGQVSYGAVSGGGDIYLAGGADDGGGRPGGFAWDTGSRNEQVQNDLGVGFGRYNDFFTGGGDLIIRAKAKNAGHAAFSFQGPSNVVTGNGRIIIDAVAQSNIEAVEFFSAADAGTLFSSHATTTPAISLSAISANQVALVMQNSDSSKPTTFQSLSSTGGGVSITANRTSSLTGAAGRLGAVNVLSVNGPITLSSDAVYEISSNGRTQKWGSGSGTDVTSSSADITFNVNAWESNTGTQGGAAFSTSGVVSVLPSSGNFFGRDVDFRHSVTSVGGLTIGKPPLAGDTNRIIDLNASQSISGEIKIYGGTVRVGVSATAALTATSTISLVARADLGVYAETVTTRGGGIWLQSRATGATEGGILVEGSGLYSNGGNILMSGGSNPLSDFAIGTADLTDRIGVNIRDVNVIQSSGGDITIRGAQGSDQDADLGGGVYVGPGETITSGAGDITIVGKLSAQTSTSVQGGILISNAANATAANINSTTGNITLHGDASSSSTQNKRGIQLYRGTITSQDGDVIVSGVSGPNSTGTWDLIVDGTSTLRSSIGKVSVLGQGQFDLIIPNLTIESNNEILIQDDQPRLSNSLYLTGSATVKIQSSSSAFVAVPDFGVTNINSTITGLTLGKETETGTFTLSKAYSINGPISVYAGTINLQGAQNSTSTSAQVLLKAKGDIITNADGDVTTLGGDIIFWSNSDGDTSAGGRVEVAAGTALNSGGGDLIIAGSDSVDARGYPAGFAKSQNNSAISSLRFAGAVNTSGGDLIFRGETASGTGAANNAGVYLEPGSAISAGTGLVSISGRVATNSSNTSNLWGLWMGDGSGAASITTTTGDILLSGDASGHVNKDNGGGVVTYNGSATSQTGNVSIQGAMSQKATIPYTGTLVDVTGWSSTRFTISTSGDVSISGSQSGTVDLRGLKIDNSDNLSVRVANLRSAATANLQANNLSIQEVDGMAAGQATLSLPSSVVISSATGNVTVGSQNVGSVSIATPISVSGTVWLQASSVTVSNSILSGGGANSRVTILADALEVSSSVKADGGIISVDSQTTNRGIYLGGTTTSPLLSLTAASLGSFFADTLRIGSAGTENIYVGGDISINNVSKLSLRASGDVRALNNAKIQVANLAVFAGGVIDLTGGNSVIGDVALSGNGGVSYSSAVSYSPAVVDNVTPVFGVGTAVSQTNSPAVQNRNAFLAVTFNPPPQFVVTDSYSNAVDSNNRLAASYTVSATTSQGTGSVVGLTASFSAGVYSFNSLRVDSNPGTYSFTVTVDDGISPFTTSSVDYNVQSGDPQQLIVTATDSTAPSGQASFSYAVSVQDQGGNPIVAGTNANLTVSASVSGAVLVSGGQVQTDNTGTATFTDLVITGSVSSQISISFFVEFTNNNSVFTTVSSAVSAVTLTPGTATQLRIDDASQSVANRSTLSALVVDLLDAQGNIVYDRTDQISVSIGSGSGATLVGTDALSFTAGASSLAQLTFNNLALQGTVGSYRLDFESDQAGIASVSHDVTLTHGAATSLTISQVASTAQSGINISNQPEITIVDADDNPVLTGATASASISASVSGAGYAIARTGVDLSGVTSLSAVSGVAAFGDLRLTGKAGSYTLSFAIPGTDLSVSQVIEVTAGAASKFKFIQLPQDVEAGQTFAQTVSAEILDATDNRVLTAGAGTVVQAVWDINGVGGSFGVTYGFVPSQGLIEFNGLTWSIANTYSLRIEVASGSVLTGIAATSSPLFVVTAAGPSKIEWVGSEPTGGVSNGSLDVQPSFVIKDQFDNEVEVAPLVTVSASVVSANSGDVVRVLGGTATNSGNQFVNFSGLGLEALVGDYVLSFSAEVAAGVFASVSTSQPVTITHGSLSALVLVTAAAGAGSDLAFDDQPVLELRDSAGNRVSTSAQASLTVRASQSGLSRANNGADLGGTIDVAAQGGVVSFTNLKLTGKVASYSLSYTVIGTAFSTSQNISLAAGDPDSFRFLQQPTDFVAGAGFSPNVSAEVIDSEGNRVLSASNQVNVVWAMNGIGSYGVTFGFVPSNGLLDLSAINFTKAASYKLRLEATGLTSVNSDTFVIGHDVAAGLEWIVDPTGGWQSGKDITTLPKLRVVDQYNNAVSTGPTVTISASVVGANSVGVLGVTGNEASGVEEIEFANLNVTAVADSYVFSFSGEVNGVTFGSITTSGTIDITHGDPTQLTIITPAAGSRAGLAFTQSPVLEIQDSAGNRVEDAALTVTVTSSNQILIGTQQTNAVAGTASFAVNLGLEGSSSNGITLTYKTTFNGQDITTSQSIDLLAGLPSSLRILEDSSTVSTRAVFSPVPSVEVLDAYGNVVLSDNDSEVTVALYRNGVAISSESDPVTASSGVVAFNGLSYIATPNSNYKLQFSHTSISAVVTSSPFVIEPGPVAKVVIHQQPRTITGGVTTTETGELFEDNAVVKLYDIDDNMVDTVDSGVITAAISSGTGGTLISASASITNGSAEFDELRLIGVVETPEQSAQEYKLTFSFGGFSSSESDVLKVKHNVATQMTMVTNALGGKASAIFTTKPKVRLLDRYGNWVSGTPAVSIQPVVFDESGLTSPSVFNAQGGEQTVNGEAEFSIGISGTTATTYRLEFIATTDQGVPITSASQSGITIGHGAASRLHILRNPASDDGSGNLTKIGSALNVQPVIEIQDSDHNRVLDFTGVIDAKIATKYRGDRDYLLNHTVSAIAGVATFSNLAIVGSITESYALSFYRLGLPSPSVTSTTFTLIHADAEYLTIETQPAGGNKTGSALSQSPTVAVRDFDGNITTTLNSQTVSAAVFSGGGAIDTTGSNTNKASVVNGIAQFSNLTVVALPGVDQSLVFTLDGAANSASGLVTSSASVTFSLIVSDAYQLSVFTEPCTAADCTAGPTAELLGVQPVVEVQDRFGNRVEGFSGLVTATLQGTGGSLRDADGQISSRSVAVSSGLATFTDLRIEGVPGNNYSLQFATSGLQSTTSQDVQVIHTTPSQLVITQQPVGGVTGDELASQPVVEVRDRFGNLAATDNATTVSVSVFSGPTRLSGLAAEVTGSLTVTAVNGVATFSGLELFARTGENYVLKFAASGFDVLSNGVVVSPAGANSLEWVTEPVAQRTGEVMNVQPVLRMLDFDGNIAASTSATVVASVTNGGGYIEAGTTSSAVEGIITFAGLTLVALPNVDQTLTFTATTASGSFSITTVTPLNVQHTAASTMSIDVGYATSNEQGVALGTQPVIKLYDRFGNLTVNDNSTVVTATIGSGAGGAISGSATATAVAGVVNFAGLAVTGSPGVDYTLDFSAGNYGVSGSAQLRLFKTAALEVSYSNIVYSSSPTTSPAIAFTDSTEHSISFSVSTPQFCTINATSGEVSIVGAGTCVIQASVADGTYYKATSKDVTLTIEKAQQDPVVITNNSFVNFGEVLTLTSSGGSSTATTRFFATGECQILGNSLITFGSATEGSAASCTILASRNGDVNYLASTAAPMDIEIRRVAQQPISIGNARNISVGDVELFLIGGSGTGAVSYAVQIGTNSAGCVVTDGVLSATKNGSCEVVATKAQSTNYNLATSAVATFTFTKQTQTVTITSAAPSMPLPGQSFQIVATASGATTISYAVTKGQAIAETQFVSASPAVCQLSQSVSGQVTFLRSGECEVTATAAASDKFASATGKMKIMVGQLNQFITFDALSDKTYGDPAFRLSAVASSGLPVSFSVSAGVSVCSISNGMVTINAAGVCEITAAQAGNGTYAPAPNVVRSFVVNPGVASSPALISAAVGNQWFTLRFTEPSYNGGSPIVAYRLEVRDQNDNLYVSTTTNTQSPLSVTAVGIPNNTPYTAKVTAITAAGLGQFSNTTVPLTPSDAAMSVTQLSADTSTSGLEMSWVTPEAIEGNFLRYEVYAWVTGTEEPSTPTVTLTDSTSDSVTVATSSISNAVSASPASYVAPRLEIVQPLFRTTGGVHIFGAVKTKPIGFFALASISQPNTASATVGYTMRVVTITDVKSSSQVINTANGVKVGLSAPSAPTQFNIDSSDPDKLVITWAAPNSDGGFPLIDYQVTSNGQVICANIQTRLCEVSPLALSTTYNIEVKARNALGLGDAAAGSHTTPDPAPVVNTQALNEQTLQLVSNLPKLSIFQPRIVRPGELVTVTGEKLDTLNTLSLGSVAVDFSVIGPNSLTFRVPVATEPGSYNIIHTSAFGTVTVMDALTVAGAAVEEEIDPVETPETDVPLIPEGSSPERPITPENGTQAPNTDFGNSGSSEPTPGQPTEPLTPEVPAPTETQEPNPAPEESQSPNQPAELEEENLAAGPVDSKPVFEFSLSLAMILAVLMILFVLRVRNERSRS